jgi:SOS response regulatory protein OraA/RecX
MEEIDETEYMTILEALIKSKLKTSKETGKYQIRNKVKSFAYGKGFEPELAEIILQELIDFQ